MMNQAELFAHGKALALVAALFQRAGIASAEEFGRLLGVFAATVSEDDPDQGDILAVWAAIVEDSAKGQG